MPGKSPFEAFSAFVEPLTDALNCVVHPALDVTPGGKNNLNIRHALTLTARRPEDYIRLDGTNLEFRARLAYKIIREPRAEYGPYRVTTCGYDYSARRTDGLAVMDWHWHPASVSHEPRPHLHLGSSQLQDDAVLSNKDHILTGRISLETVVRQLIDLGARPRVEDWDKRLQLREGVHVLYRSWQQDYERETGRPTSDLT